MNTDKITLLDCADASDVAQLRSEYLAGLTAPMDGMWESFANAAAHTEMLVDGQKAGYYVLNDDNALLQFYVTPNFRQFDRALFDHVIAHNSVSQAIVATIDPHFLSLCLDVHKTVSVHTLLYELRAEGRAGGAETDGVTFRLIDESELDRTIGLQLACLEAGQELGGWLRDYSATLIERRELFVLCRGDDWLGLGEYRKSDSQDGVVDLGMMVSPDHRRLGLATDMMNRLAANAAGAGLRPICSTTVDNTGAQRAIAKADFVSRHRILSVTF